MGSSRAAVTWVVLSRMLGFMPGQPGLDQPDLAGPIGRHPDDGALR